MDALIELSILGDDLTESGPTIAYNVIIIFEGNQLISCLNKLSPSTMLPILPDSKNTDFAGTHKE